MNICLKTNIPFILLLFPMKKYFLIVLLFSFFLLWCQKSTVTPPNISTINVSSIVDIPSLKTVLTQVSDAIVAWTTSMDQAQHLVDQLQQKYVALTNSVDTGIDATFTTIQHIFNEKSISLYWIPLWAKRLWMTQPQGMILDTSLSKYSYASWYSSVSLIYTWAYDLAMQQAKIIADTAHLYVSKNFQQAQALAKVWNVDYISGLDIGGLSQWIVYVNHELLDTNADQLSVSVDQQWTLTIEATKIIVK